MLELGLLQAHVTCQPGPLPMPCLDLLTGSYTTSVLLFPWPSKTMVCQPLLSAPPLHPSCHRCGSKLPFRSSTPWVWASGVSSPLPPTTHFTRTSIGQCSLLDPGGLSGEEKGWPGRASWGEAGPAHLACTWTSPGRDTFIVTLGNAITSILAGFAIFSVLGYMSQELGVPVDQVAKAGRQAAGPRWVRVCVGTAGPGQESLFVDRQSCEWDVECVCACMNVT